MGACFCTRCQRYDTLNKLKRMFAGFGGNLATLQSESPIEQLAGSSEQISSRTKLKVRCHSNSFNTASFWKPETKPTSGNERVKLTAADHNPLKRERDRSNGKENSNSIEANCSNEHPRKLRKLR